MRRVEWELAAQVGRPSFAQRLLIARMMLRLEQFDKRFDEGTLTEFDVKVLGGLQNAIRLCLRDLGLKPEPVRARMSPLADHFSRPPA